MRLEGLRRMIRLFTHGDTSARPLAVRDSSNDRRQSVVKIEVRRDQRIDLRHTSDADQQREVRAEYQALREQLTEAIGHAGE